MSQKLSTSSGMMTRMERSCGKSRQIGESDLERRGLWWFSVMAARSGQSILAEEGLKRPSLRFAQASETALSRVSEQVEPHPNGLPMQLNVGMSTLSSDQLKKVTIAHPKIIYVDIWILRTSVAHSISRRQSGPQVSGWVGVAVVIVMMRVMKRMTMAVG